MTTAFAIAEGFESADARRKRLGQYYSGLPVSKLLVALSAHRRIRTVIDPMGGRGDMLQAAQKILTGCRHFAGIEIDPIAHNECISTFSPGEGNELRYVLGDAFDDGIAALTLPEGYDLVVTNPPYVRYQSQRTSAGEMAKLPSALQVRNGLIRSLEQRRALPESDREIFLTLAQEYSGLADLAVPSWILCASLVKPGGTLAVVVPDAWLNRDYAVVIRYLLMRFFQIEFIIEDAHAAWFADAQVKTTLLIGKRIADLKSIRHWNDETYLHMMLPSQLANQTSLVGRTAFASTKHPERAFAKHMREVLNENANLALGDCKAHQIKLRDQVLAVAALGASESWFKRLEPTLVQVATDRFAIPSMLAEWFDNCRNLVTLQELGVKVGQGLRTGANDFFYAEKQGEKNGIATLVSSKHFGSSCIAIPSSCARPVVRKQSDLPGTQSIDVTKLRGAVLTFHGWALPEDALAANARPLPKVCAEFVRLAADAIVSGKPLPTLTAVAPNARAANAVKGAPARFWYMLPDFAPRHKPDLFLARVNSQTPIVFLNPGRAALIDANFSSLWLADRSPITVDALLAILSSSLVAALFEFTGTVMGGGALKLEATHIRSLPLPNLSAEALRSLHSFGRGLATSTRSEREAIVNQIDMTICQEMFGRRKALRKLVALHDAIQHRQRARSKGQRWS